MFHPDKQRHALAALHHVLIVSRSLVYEGESQSLADILDTAEYLVVLLLDKADRTTELRAQLSGLAAQFPALHRALERFDAEKSW